MHLLIKLFLVFSLWVGLKSYTKKPQKTERIVIGDQIICHLYENRFEFSAYYQIHENPYSTHGRGYSTNPLKECRQLEEQFDRFRNAPSIAMKLPSRIKKNCLIDYLYSVVRCDNMVCPLLDNDESECFYKK